MRKAGSLKIFAVIVTALCLSGRDSAVAQAGAPIRLWAAIGVPKPLFGLHETEQMSLDFVVVNDGQTAANPDVESTHLFVNGVEPADWTVVIANGLRNSAFEALPPGEFLSFNYQLGPRYFAAPGIYKVRWEGPKYKSAEITFRVLPGGN